MAHEEAVARLPLTYQQILAWVAEGRSRDDIAAALDVDPMAVESLEQLARAKLARLAGVPSPPTSRGSTPDAEHSTRPTD